HLPRHRRELLLQGALLDDADRAVPRRAHRRQVRRLLQVDPGVDHDQGMTAPALTGGEGARPAPGVRRRAAALLHRRPRLRLSLLLSAPLAWLVVVYLGAL